MYGIEFRKADNALICGSCEFEARYANKPYRFFRVRFHPDIGMAVDESLAKGWETILERATDEDLEKLLPKRQDFGVDWTTSKLMFAMTFYGEGYKIGHYHGEAAEREWRQRRNP